MSDIYFAKSTPKQLKRWKRSMYGYELLSLIFIKLNLLLKAGEPFDKVAREYSEDKAKGESI